MKENFQFKSIQEELQRKKTVETKPLTLEENTETTQTPMSLKDHWLSLRQSIQDKLTIEAPTPEEQERTKQLHELITPELAAEYKQILKVIISKTKKTETHPQREFVDINNPEISGQIETWIENLITEVKRQKSTELDENDTEELRSQCWLFFNSLESVENTRIIEKDIADFYKQETTDDTDENEQTKKSKLVKELENRYQLTQTEAEILVDLVKNDANETENYSPEILIETIAKLWKEYNLGQKKAVLTKISLGYLMSKGVESFAPSLFQNIMAHDKFNLAVFLEYWGLGISSEAIDAKTNIELAKVMNEINHQINERITNSLFFQEFEFIHEKSLGEIYAALGRGKNATEQILQDTISKFAPTLTGIAMSLAFLTKINPALGAIGIGSLPIMYRLAKKQNEKVWPMYEKEKREGEKITTQLGSIKSGFEEVKTSAEMPAVAAHVKEQMNIKDTLSLQRFIEETKMRLKRMIPFEISTIIAASAGAALQETGLISGGAVLSNIIYSNQLNRPVQELVNLYFNQFSRHIQDIQRMEEILGEYEKLDLPEGEKEKNRVPISTLGNFNISIKNLRYKNILRGVNLDIQQGEFVTIAGASGAGKSTLLRNLIGLYKSDGGTIAIGGVVQADIKKYGPESLYSAISYCNQTPQIFEEMTLRENLVLWSKKEIDDTQIKKVLADLHLEKFSGQLDAKVKNLSGGEKVRIGVARTLIKGAKIMLLDEPTASLDSQAATEVRKIIAEINIKYPDTTIICVSHDEELIHSSGRSINITELQQNN